MADKELAAVKALATQAGSGPAARQTLIASGAVPKLAKHLSSKTGAVASQSALALNLLASDPSTRPAVWEHQRALVPALVQALKTGGPLTQERALAALAAFIQHVAKAGAAVIKANGVVLILRVAREGSEGPRDAAMSALNAFHMAWNDYTVAALQQTTDLQEPLIRALSDGQQQTKLFAIRVLRVLPLGPKVLQVLRRPAVTDLLVGFATGDDVDMATMSLEFLDINNPIWAPMAGGNLSDALAAQEAAYQASPALARLWETLLSRLQSPKVALVKATVHYVIGVSDRPSLTAMPWFRECMSSIPRLLQSPSDVLKLQGLHLARHAWLDRFTPEMEDLCQAALTLIVNQLDPRPAARARVSAEDPDCYAPKTALNLVVTRLANKAYALAKAEGVAPLPPTSLFLGCAELAEAAGAAVAALSEKAWGFNALFRARLYNLVPELQGDKLWTRGVVATMGRLFCFDKPLDAQKFLLAGEAFGHSTLESIFDCIKDGAPQMVETATQAVGRVLDFIVEYAKSPGQLEICNQVLLASVFGHMYGEETFKALWPRVEAAFTAIFSKVGGLDAFKTKGGFDWAIAVIEDKPEMLARVGALRVLSAAVTAADRESSCVTLKSSDLEVIVGLAKAPPAELTSQEAMRLLCLFTKGHPSGYKVHGSSGVGSQPASASRTSLPPSEGNVAGRSGDGGNEAGSTPLHIPAELKPHIPADLAPDELAPHIPADLAPDELAPDNPHELAPDKPGLFAELAPRKPAELTPHMLVELAPEKPGELAPGMRAEMVRLGAAKAAVAHLKGFAAHQAPGGVGGSSSELTKTDVAKFLCWISVAEGVFPDLQDSGGLELLVDLMHSLEPEERKQAGEAVALLALNDPAACAALQLLHAVTVLVSRLKDRSGADPRIVLLAIAALIRDSTGRRPAPGAVDDLLAAGGVPELLLRILASGRENGSIFAVEPLHLIACDPDGAAKIVAADYAQPLICGLVESFILRHPYRSGLEAPDKRADVIRLISKIVEERPEQGNVLITARLPSMLATILSGPLDMPGRMLAMELVENLGRYVPGACKVLMAHGVLGQVHKWAVATPASTNSAGAANIPGGKELVSLVSEFQGLCQVPEPPVSVAETAHAAALLRRLAGYCGGTLEIANGDGQPILYTSRSDSGLSQATADGPETGGVPHCPSASDRRTRKKVCLLCGAVSQEKLRKCGRCKVARYCSKECLDAHWPVHRRECQRQTVDSYILHLS